MKLMTTCLILLLANSAFSKDKIIDFKQKKGLKADEGLVILMINSNFRVSKVSLAKPGKIFPVYSMKKIYPGNQMKIIKLKAGTYFWKDETGHSGNTTYTLKMDKDITSFSVKPGKLNYPGTLHIKAWAGSNGLYGEHNMQNASTSILAYIKEKYPSLLEKYPLVYSGNNPDPFLEFNKELNKKQ